MYQTAKNTILRNMASSEVDQPLSRAFSSIMDKGEAAILQTEMQTSGIGNESLYIKKTFSERFQP